MVSIMANALALTRHYSAYNPSRALDGDVSSTAWWYWQTGQPWYRARKRQGVSHYPRFSRPDSNIMQDTSVLIRVVEYMACFSPSLIPPRVRPRESWMIEERQMPTPSYTACGLRILEILYYRVPTQETTRYCLIFSIKNFSACRRWCWEIAAQYWRLMDWINW